MSDPLYTIDLKGTKDYSISIFPKDAEDHPNYPAVSSQSDYGFELSDWQAEKIMPSRDELLKKSESGSNASPDKTA